MPTGPEYIDLETAEGPGFTSVPLYRQSVRKGKIVSAGETGQRCPNKWGWHFVNGATGEHVPAGCGGVQCLVCGPYLATATAGAIGLAAPERFIRLTLVGEDWQTVRGRMKRLGYCLRREVKEWEWVWFCEANPKGTGHHVHAFQHGRFVPQRKLSELADYVGMGRHTDIRKWVSAGPLATGYGIKGYMYGMKEAKAKDHDVHAGYLEANGGWLQHASRHYWRTADGKSCSVKDARKAWRALRGDNADDWSIVFRPGWEEVEKK